jgi:hypothetical protein
LLLSIASQPPRSARTKKRESTDEHNTDAPSIYRGFTAATDASRPVERACASSFDHQSPSATGDDAAAGHDAAKFCGSGSDSDKTQGRRETCQEGLGETPEKEGEGQKAHGEGGRAPRRQRARQEGEPQG